MIISLKTCFTIVGRFGKLHGENSLGAPIEPKTGSIGPKNPKKTDNPGYNNYGIFWQFYGDFRFK